MKTLQQLQQIINQAVNSLTYPGHPVELYEPITYILSIGGKRLRPALLLMACDLFDGDVEKAVNAALGIEVFHNFTLMHDDIMDNAPLRRGKITVHERWNNSVAILSGDAMLVNAYELMVMDTPDPLLRRVLTIFNKLAFGVCEGQQIDMNFEQNPNVSPDEYIGMIKLKTAVLLGGALRIGALLGGAPDEDAEKLCSFGEHLGIAFQLQDDLLDVYGDPEKFGKQVGGDIISNKKTYLLIKALELAKDETSVELNKWLSEKQFDAKEKVAAVTNIYNMLAVAQYTEIAIQTYAEKAFEALDCVKLTEDRKQYLRSFADSLLVREY
jgi:geranylgeranyl diphosphate synthase type II